MKRTGNIHRIDSMGRIIIPVEIWKTMRLKTGDLMEVSTNGTQILLRKHNSFTPVQNVLGDMKDIIQEDKFLLNRDKVLRKIKELEELLEEKEEVQE